MKVVKIILGVLVGLVVIYLLTAAFVPAHFKVVRSIEINRPVPEVYDEMRYFKNFPVWSPWHEKDPNMKTTITGTDGEPGAKYEWTSEDKEVGSGSLTRIHQDPNRSIVSELRIKDWGTVSKAGYEFEEANGGTKVSWYTEGDLSFFMRPMGLMFDGMMGADFEKGLGKVKKHLEGSPS